MERHCQRRERLHLFGQRCRPWLRCCGVVAVLSVIGAPLVAQEYRGTIAGRITDTSGAGVPRASVAVRNVADNTVTRGVSDDTGFYVVSYLTPATYQVSVEAQGFKAAIRDGILVRVNDRLTLDVKLEVGEITESVTVSGESPLLTTETASMGQVISNRLIADLPLNGRNPFVLQTLSAGVVQTSNPTLARPWNTNEVSDVSINGAPSRGNMISINGVYAKGGNQVAFTPSVDAVQEFKVQKNPYDAATGHQAGGTINVVTKAGTNTFRGSGAYFLRDDAFDANNFFGKRAKAKKPEFRMNQFAGTAGGPVRLPGYDGRSKTFWFFNYEGLRQGAPPSTFVTRLPTSAERNGDFSQTFAANGQLIVIYDPLTTRPDPARPGSFIRTPFPGNRIPADRINPVARNVMDFIPLPNQPGDPLTGAGNYVRPSKGSEQYDQYGLRIDHNFGSRGRIFGMLGKGKYRQDAFNPFDNQTTEFRAEQPTRTVSLDYVHIFTPRLLGNVRYGFSRKRQQYPLPPFDPTTLGFPPALVSQLPSKVFPFFNIGDAAAFGSRGPSYNFSDGHNLSATVTRTTGRHNFNAGTYLLLLGEEDGRGSDNGASGIYTFGRDWTGVPRASSPTAGHGMATFLLGYPSSGQVGVGAYQDNKTSYYEFFAQDDFKVTSRLTLNLGLRWEFQGPTTEGNNKILRSFDPTATPAFAAAAAAAYAANPVSQRPPADFNPRGGLVFAAHGGAPRSYLDPEWNNWAPRIGLSYRITDKMVLRGGAGVFYNPRLTGVNSNGFTLTTAMVTTIDGLTPLNNLSNPFPAGLPQAPCASRSPDCLAGQTVSLPNPKLTTPKTTTWSTGFQLILPTQILFEANYVGSRTTDFNPGWGVNAFDPKFLDLGFDLARPVPNPFFGLIPANVGALGQSQVPLYQLLTPFPSFGINTSQAVPGTGHAQYHSLQLTADRRFSSGVSFLASYTRSKLMERSGYLNPGFSREVQNVISGIDRPHRLVFTGLWELPFGRGKAVGGSVPALVDAFIGGWQLNGIFTYQSGAPLNTPGVPTGQSPSLGSARTFERWLNKDAFSIVPNVPFYQRTFQPRFGEVRSDAYKNADLSMLKNVRAGGRVTVQVRAELFNAFNLTQFGTPDLGLTSQNFGRISSQANLPRQFQFGLKLTY